MAIIATILHGDGTDLSAMELPATTTASMMVTMWPMWVLPEMWCAVDGSTEVL